MITPPSKPLNALVSFVYFENRVSEIKRWTETGMNFILDSGAFSALSLGKTVDLDAYATWLRAIGQEHYSWAASLDVIGNPKGSWSNFRSLRSMDLDVVPTIHVGTDVHELDRYAELGIDLVGLGGMARRKDPQNVLRWLVKMFRYARDHHPDVRFHGWGVTRKDYLEHLPFWSVDSAGFGAAYRYAQLSIFNDQTGVLKVYDLNGKGTHAEAGAYLRSLGVTPREIMKSGPANRLLLVGLGAHHAQAMERYYTRRHKVSAPRSLVDGRRGTHVHFAESGPHHVEEMRAALDGSPSINEGRILGTKVHVSDGPTPIVALGRVLNGGDDPREGLPGLRGPRVKRDLGTQVHMAEAPNRVDQMASVLGTQVHYAEGDPYKVREIDQVLTGTHIHMAESSIPNLTNLSGVMDDG